MLKPSKNELHSLKYLKPIHLKQHNVKLTGKAEQDFEEWYREKYFPINLNSTSGHKTSIINKSYIGLDRFWHLELNMQWGVYVDFFDSKDLMIGIRLRRYDSLFIAYINWDAISLYETREETQTAAIQKANEMCNNQ